MRVKDLDIPAQVKEIIINRGYQELYPPQLQAIKAGVLEGKNLVMASPTASGKTLIAELTTLKHVINGSGKVIYLTPLRALAWEKFNTFQAYSDIGKKNGRKIKIGISTGDLDSSTPWLETYDVIITTNEKCDSLLRHRAPWMNNVTLVIADEIHLIGGDRGPTLEVTLARLRQMKTKIQIIALSATVRNFEEVADWLNAEWVASEWRPVELREGVELNNTVFFRDGKIKVLKPLYHNKAINIALSTIFDKGQALIFVESRRRSMSLAKEAASALVNILSKGESSDLHKISSDILIQGERTSLSEQLASIVSNGAAFHHAGLRTEHRHIIEESFREGKIKIIVATPTLAAGVNLPARTVVIGSYRRFVPGYGMYPISVLEYKQMSGRAGRPQYDEFGEAILISNSHDEQDSLMENYVLSKPERLYSRLAQESALRSHTLAAVASDYAHSERGILDFFGGTFYGYHYPMGSLKLILGSIMGYLSRERMIQNQGEYIYATDFGRRISELYIDPQTAVVLRDGLKRGAPEISDFTWLHLICRTPDMRPILRPRKRDSESVEIYIEDHRDEFTCHLPFDVDPINYDQFLGEVKTAMVLNAWIDGKSENEILRRYFVQPGDRYSAVHNAEWLLYSAHEIANVLDISNQKSHLRRLREQVKHGVPRKLLPLVRIHSIGRVRAQILYNAGFTSIKSLKRAPVNRLIELPLIGARLAKIIKEQVGGTIEEGEWRSLQLDETDQKAITDFEEGSEET